VSDLSFPVSLHAGLAVVTTPDEVDIGNSGLLRAALQSAASADRPVIVVDMTDTEFCDSTGLNVLVLALKQANQDGGQIRLVVRGMALQRILNVSGVGTMFQIYDSLSQALQAA
jgi:anti-sigma B factor antagonist